MSQFSSRRPPWGPLNLASPFSRIFKNTLLSSLYERLPNISIFSYVLADLPFFQITSDYLIPCFPWSPFGESFAILEESTFTRQAGLPPDLENLEKALIFEMDFENLEKALNFEMDLENLGNLEN